MTTHGDVSAVLARSLARLAPPPRLALADWVERTVHLPDGSATPGPVRLWKPQRGIANAIGDPTIERVTLVKAVRCGFTTLLSSAVGHFVANDPSPILFLQPTESDARDFVVSDLEPLFDATPALRGTLTGDFDEAGRSTLAHRIFPGGSLKVVAAKSPRNLRRHTVRVLFIDEADAMEASAEGSPITLAEKRTLSFANRKIVLGSTPVDLVTSNVLKAYDSSDQRVFEVPCPECGGLAEVLWKDIVWPEIEPDRAAWRCPHCAELISERFKAEMVERGDWRATRPEVKGHAGFRLNALVSPLANAAWGMLAKDFLRAKGDPDQLKVFVTTLLAEGWKDAVDEVDETKLLARAEPFGLNVTMETGDTLAIPREVLVITAGVDVQDDRLEISWWGWSATEAFVLAHGVIWGSPDDETTWLELDAQLKTAWRHPLGGEIRVDAAVVDSGDGDWTAQVYAFCHPRASRRIMAGKGQAGALPAIKLSPTKVKGGRLWIVGVDGIKTTIGNRLARGASIRFSTTLEPDYYEQLTSERKTLRTFHGRPVYRWERVPGRRAEALDCAVYAYAARQVLQVDFAQREAELSQTAAPAQAWRKHSSPWMRG